VTDATTNPFVKSYSQHRPELRAEALCLGARTRPLCRHVVLPAFFG
jgi:hypothetical protein